MGIIWVDMGVICHNLYGLIWGSYGVIWVHMGVILGSHGGGNVPHFFWNLPRDPPPPLIFHNFGAQKNVPQSFGSGRDPPPPFGKFPEKSRFFFWKASLRTKDKVEWFKESPFKSKFKEG